MSILSITHLSGCIQNLQFFQIPSLFFKGKGKYNFLLKYKTQSYCFCLLAIPLICPLTSFSGYCNLSLDNCNRFLFQLPYPPACPLLNPPPIHYPATRVIVSKLLSNPVPFHICPAIRTYMPCLTSALNIKKKKWDPLTVSPLSYLPFISSQNILCYLPTMSLGWCMLFLLTNTSFPLCAFNLVGSYTSFRFPCHCH